MKRATVKLNGNKAAEIYVYDNGFEFKGSKGYKFYNMFVGHLSNGTVRRYALQYSCMYLTGAWESKDVSLGRLTKCIPC